MNNAVILEQVSAATPLGSLNETVDALIKGTCPEPGPCFGVESAFAPFPDIRYRNIRFAASQLASAMDFSSITPQSLLFINCMAKGDIHSLEDIVTGKASQVDVSPLVDSQAAEACKALGISPARTLSISTACASGAIAIEVAKEMLELQRYTHVVLFGIESLCSFVATGFNALSALSPERARPFDADRNGLSLGETAVTALLSYRLPASGDSIIAGAGSSNDANHRTGPSRTGEGLLRAAQAACRDASMVPEEIGAVKCHGTATAYNDAMESKAITNLFSDSCPPCSSFKGAIGHTSGAGSLLECCIASRCLKKQILPPTVGYVNHGVDENIAASNEVQAVTKPSMLCLSAGFGGINAAIIIREMP